MNMDVINRVAALIYRIENGRVFVLLTEEQSGFWTMPGGGFELEDGDITGTLHRELGEELSLVFGQYAFNPTNHTFEFVYQQPTHPRYGMKGVLHGFLVELHPEAVPAAADDIKSIAWYPADEVTSVLTHEDNKELFQKMIVDLI